MNIFNRMAWHIYRRPNRAAAIFPSLFAPRNRMRVLVFTILTVLTLLLTPSSSFAAVNLSHDVPLAPTGSMWFSYTPTQSYWAAVGIRPTAGTDWDVKLYPQESASGLLASSTLGSTAVDFVVVDYHHTAKNKVYPYAERYSGTGNATIHAYYGSDTLTAGTAVTEIINNGIVDVVRVWDVYLNSGQTYTFRFGVNAGSLDLGMALFKSAGTSYYAGKSAAVASSDSHGTGASEEFSYTATASDHYGLVVYNNSTDLVTETITLAVNPPEVTSLSPSSAFFGEEITINGTNFGTTPGTVKFYNNLSAPIVSWSNTQIRCTVPYGTTTGIVTVSATAGPTGAYDNDAMFTLAAPDITSINPTSTSHGGVVVINGTHFSPTYWESSSVKFASNLTASIVSWSNTQIVAVVPAGATSGNILVTTLGGSDTLNFTLGLPQSPHNYPASSDFTCEYTLPGSPKAIYVAFDAQTYVEPSADWIFVGNLTELTGSPFTGNSLAGQTKRLVEGGTVKVRLVSGAENHYYGFKVNSVVEADIDPPPAPINLYATPGSWTGNNSFAINWTNPVDNMTGIAGGSYKLGSPPASNYDKSGDFNGNSFTVLATEMGGQTLYVWLRDGEGNTNYINRSTTTLYYDGESPTVPIDLSASPTAWTNNPTFTISWTDPADTNGIAGAWYKRDSPPTAASDGTFTTSHPSFSVAATASGGQMVYVWLQDGVGNQYYYNYSGAMLHYDNTAPSNPNSVTESGGMVSNAWQSAIGDPSFSWSGADDTGGSGLKGYSVYWGPDPAGEPGTVYEQASHIYDPAAFSGTYYLRVRTFDNAGNMSSPITLFTAKHDATAPTNPGTATEAGGMVSGAWQSAVTDPAFTWSGAADPGGAGVKGYSVYWGTADNGEPGLTYEQAAASHDPGSFTGTYYLRVRTFDEAGNRSDPATIFTARHDGAAPAAPVLNETVCGDAWCNHSAPSFSWTAPADTGGSGVAAYYGIKDGGSAVAVTSPYAPSWTDGTHTFKIYAADAAGNLSPHSNTKTVRIDTQLPVSACSALAAYLPALFTVQWSGTDTGDSQLASYDVQYKAGSGGAWTDWATGTALTSMTFGPASDGTYYFRSRARDAAGNTEAWPLASGGDAFTTVDASSPTAPSITSPSHAAGAWNVVSDDPQFSWTAADGGSGIAGYSVALDRSVNFALPAVMNLAGNSTPNTTGYSNVADGSWYFHARAKDNAGNWGAASYYGPVKIDLTPPSFVSILPARNPAPEGDLVITIRASEQLSVVSATVTQSGGTPAPLALTSQDNITWTGTYAVAPGLDGTAAISVSGSDLPGKSGSAAASFLVDTVLPSQPALTCATHPENTPTSKSAAAFSWTAASDIGTGLAGYSYAVNGIPDYSLDTATDTASTAVNISTADGTYWMHLRAVDNAGNGGAVSRYKFIVDVTSPVFAASFSRDPAPAGQLAVTLDAGEVLAAPPSVSVAQYGKSPPTPLSMSTADNTVWTAAYTVVPGFDGTASLSVTGTDPAGNTGAANAAFQADTVEPTAAITLSPAGALNNGPFSLELTLTDANAIDGTPSLTFTPSGQTPVSLSLSGSDKNWTAQGYIETTMSTGTAVFALSAADAAGNNGSVITAGGTFTIDSAVSGSAGGTVTNADGTGIKITPGAYAGGLILSIDTPDEDLADILEADRNTPRTTPVSGVNLRRSFTARDSATGALVTTFSQPLILAMPYPDADNDGLIDSSGLRESKLKLFWLNPAAKQWEEVAGAGQDFAGNKFTAAVTHFSIYAVLTVAPESVVYPVPWKPGSGGSFDSASDLVCGTGLIFDFLPADARIRIYNYQGDLLRELRLTAADNGCKVWDGRNSAGRDVASGVYLAVIETATGGRTVKKLAIER